MDFIVPRAVSASQPTDQMVVARSGDHVELTPWRNWIAHWTSNPEVAGSNPVGVESRLFSKNCLGFKSRHGYRRVAHRVVSRSGDGGQRFESGWKRIMVRGADSSMVRIRAFQA